MKRYHWILTCFAWAGAIALLIVVSLAAAVIVLARIVGFMGSGTPGM